MSFAIPLKFHKPTGHGKPPTHVSRIIAQGNPTRDAERLVWSIDTRPG
jgi:hypothetical protein